MGVILDVRNVSVRFGGVVALDNVSFEVNKGEFLCLIGPNGAGKTTMMRAITGVIKPQTARVLLTGKDISSLPTHKRARLGLALTHQIVRPFRSMTVLDNVALTAGHRRIRRIFTSMVSVDRSAERKQARKYLKLVGIDDVSKKSVQGQPLGGRYQPARTHRGDDRTQPGGSTEGQSAAGGAGQRLQNRRRGAG